MKKAGAAKTRAAQHGVDAIAMAATAPLAAMVTLNSRLPLLFEAVSGSGAWSHPEFVRMNTEKVQAAQKAASAMGDAVLASQRALTSYANAEMSAHLSLMTATPRTAAALQDHAEGSLRRLTTLAATLGEISLKCISASMRPAHQKVTANARRLGAKGQSR